MSRESLEILGLTTEQAAKTIQAFRDYDDMLIEEQSAIYDDEAKLIETALASRLELESLFDSDFNEAKKDSITKVDIDAIKYPKPLWYCVL